MSNLNNAAPESTSGDGSGDDSGFTLMEVIWALFLLGLIAMGALGLFLNGAKTAAHLQRNQAAVSVASGAMDVVRSVSGGAVNATGTSGVIKGRSKAAVEASWAAATALDASDTADMTEVWDPEGGLTYSDQWVPISTTVTVDNQKFTIHTLIGKCFRPRAAATTDQDCVATSPSPADAYIEMYRARVIVRWDEGDASTGENSYRLSTLIDPSEDATWNTAVNPYAYDDEVSIDAGAPATAFAVVLNDSVEYNPSGGTSPIVSLTQPKDGNGNAMGSVAKGTGAAINSVVYTPPGDTSKSGTVTFTYKVRGSSGVTSSDPATVTVHILPVVNSDVIAVEPNATTTITSQMLANDLGVTNVSSSRKTTIVPVWRRTVDMFSAQDVSPETIQERDDDAALLAANGIAMSGEDVEFTAPATEGTVTEFYYYLVDDDVTPGGVRFPSELAGKVTLTVTSVELFTPDVSVTLSGTVDDTWNDIDWQDLTGNDPDTTITIHDVAGPGLNDNLLVRLDGTGNATGGLGTGEILEFLTEAGIDGTYELEYSVVSAGGNDSVDTGIITVEVTPLPTGPAAPIATGASITIEEDDDEDLELKDLGPATSGVKITDLSEAIDGSGNKCKALNNPKTDGNPADKIEVESKKNKVGVCTFTYTLTMLNAPYLTSAPATVTVTVVEDD